MQRKESCRSTTLLKLMSENAEAEMSPWKIKVLNVKYQRHRANKKRNKRKTNVSERKPININWFVLDRCRRLGEKKSFMVYTVVGCLGVSALNDLVRDIFLDEAISYFKILCSEQRTNKFIIPLGVDAIQVCGGQTVADGRRNRTGGAILWNMIKAWDPAAYGEIMKNTKEFDKQFNQQNIHTVTQNKEGYFGETGLQLTDGVSASVQDDSQFTPQSQPEQSNTRRKCKSVHERIRKKHKIEFVVS